MKKKLIENSLIYSGVQILQGGIGFLLLPIYTRFLSPNDYGTVSVINAVVALLSIFYLLGLNGALYRYYLDFKDNQELMKRFCGTIITFLIALSLVLSFFLLIFGKFILHPFTGKIEFYPYLLLGIIGAAVSSIFTVYQFFLQAQHKGREFGILKFSNFLISSFLMIVFVTVLKLKATGPILAVTVTSILFFLYALWRMKSNLVFVLDAKFLKKGFSYSLPIVPHALTGWVANFLDRLLINRFVSTSAAGIYNIGYLFGGIQAFINTAVNQAYTPWFFEEMKRNQTEKVKKFFILAMTLYITLAMLVTVFAKEALWIMTKGEFRESWKLVGLFSFGNLFGGYYYFLVNQLFFSDRGTKYVPIATVSAALFSLSLNLVLIPKYGMLGAAVTMLFTNIITALLVCYFAQRIQPVNWNHKLILKMILINGFVCIFSYYFSLLTNVSNSSILVMKILIVFLCTFVNYHICIKESGDLDILRKFPELIKAKFYF